MRRVLFGVALTWLVALGAAEAQTRGTAEPTPDRELERESESHAPKPVGIGYIPPAPERPAIESRSAGITRGSADVGYIPPAPEKPSPKGQTTAITRGSWRDLPTLTLLVPEHVGLTLRGQPTLYWHASGETSARIVVTLIDETSIRPLAEVQVPKPVAAGVHAFRLADHGVELGSGQLYEWSVTVVVGAEPSSADLVAKGFIERVRADPELAAALRAPDPISRSRALARKGVWYDALSTLSEDPDASGQKESRTALLGQVGLGELETRP